MSERSKALKNNMNGWDTSLDLIRIVAFLSVLFVHFFYRAGFYKRVMIGERAYISLLIRTLFMDCIPLFLLLTGYLMNQKKASVKYYKGLLKILFMYVLAGICCQIFSYLREPVSFKTIIASFLSFDAAPYAWYVEMYIGLFLLIPFLNLAWNALPNKKAKLGLVITMLVLTSLPFLLRAEFKFIPVYWYSVYPVSYYFVGAYLSEFPPKIKKRYLLLLLAAHVLLTGSNIFWRNYGIKFAGKWTNWADIRNLITGVLVFLLLKGIHTENWNLKFRKFLRYLGSLTFGAYLVSWIFDTICYGYMRERIPELGIHFEYMFLIVPVVAVCSLLLSALLNLINKYLLRGADWCISKIQNSYRKHREKATVK